MNSTSSAAPPSVRPWRGCRRCGGSVAVDEVAMAGIETSTWGRTRPDRAVLLVAVAAALSVQGAACNRSGDAPCAPPAATPPAVLPTPLAADSEADKKLCLRTKAAHAQPPAVVCVVETTARKPVADDETMQLVTGHVTLGQSGTTRRAMAFDRRVAEGAAGHLYITYSDTTSGHTLSLSWCNPCEPPRYDELSLKAGSQRLVSPDPEIALAPAGAAL